MIDGTAKEGVVLDEKILSSDDSECATREEEENSEEGETENENSIEDMNFVKVAVGAVTSASAPTSHKEDWAAADEVAHEGLYQSGL
ncbi:hypothetical protein U1Q18_022944 [Sarracenia purpurea var. burkii]